MRRWLTGLVVLALAAGAAWAGWQYFGSSGSAVRYRLAKVERGALVSTVAASGTVNPVTSVIVGSQLSGQIAELMADFNSEVKAGQIIARLDTESLNAKRKQTVADLEAAKAAVTVQRAQLENAQAALVEAERDLKRKRELLGRGATSSAEADRSEATHEKSKAQVAMAKAQIENAIAQVRQREAAINQVDVDLERSLIRAPIDGVVVQRNVDVGQTVAASLQAPTLFTIAQDLRQMQVHASVDEADVGRVLVGQTVTFTVDAFPGRTFMGAVEQVRKAPQVVQNVVSYTVVITADNSDQRLLPGMTANARVVIDRREDSLKVPNAALRYRPAGSAGAAPTASAPAAGGGGPQALESLAQRLTTELSLTAEQQRQMREIFEDARPAFAALGRSQASPEERRQQAQNIRQQISARIEAILTPEQRPVYARLRANAGAAPTTGQAWIVGGDGRPQAVALRLGISDGSFTEVIGGELKPGQEVIVGATEAKPAAGGPPRLGF